MSKHSRYPIVVLISGNGSNLQAIIDAHLPIDIRALISNDPKAYGLQRAKNAGIQTEVVDHTLFSSRTAFEQALGDHIAKYQPELIVLAGFMRILGKDIVKRFAGKIINLHPSLLPKYPGLNTHAKAIANKDKVHGATIHYVTEALDAGPIIAQAQLAIEPNDTPDTLKEKVQALEHKLLPEVIQQLATAFLT